MDCEIVLRYGFNPHQVPAKILMPVGRVPFRVLNGSPSAINIMDAVNAWQLVSQMRRVFDMPAAVSFKHVSPSGAGLAVPLSDSLRKAYLVEDMDLSPLATAYARARGCDRMASYGDCAGFGDVVDVSSARLLAREVSDVVVAPGYDQEALSILSKKRGGRYLIIEMDPLYEPDSVERRDLYGMILEQKRNDWVPSRETLSNVVTKNCDLSAEAARDLLLCMLVLKYTQSNSICFACDGQTIGVGAGQQSRIHCTRIAAAKADTWYLRQHPWVLDIRFKAGVKRHEKANAIEAIVGEESDERVFERLADVMNQERPQLGRERESWLRGMKGVSLGSDGLIPFRDTIDRGYRSGVEYVVQPGGSIRDDAVLDAADEYGMVMVYSGVRMFHH